MPETRYRGRSAFQLENDRVRVTVLAEGGHIAGILEKSTGVNPLWTPPWPSIEHSAYDRARHTLYGSGAESKLLAGIMGHSACLDLFGEPSPEEAAAGITVHGEASVVPYAIAESPGCLTTEAILPAAQLRFVRKLRLEGAAVLISESVENLSALDRPIAWTQHVTLGPPFLEKGGTLFRASATRSLVVDFDCSGAEYMKPGAEFDWPHAPRAGGGTADLRVFTGLPASGAFTAHLMDPDREDAFFLAWAPSTGVLFGYIWKTADFPWLGIWEENFSRKMSPWDGQALTRGMEFGVSPLPETRRKMIERGRMFSVPCYRWLPARTTLRAEYRAFVTTASSISESPAMVATMLS